MKRIIPESIMLAEREKELNGILEYIDLILLDSHVITNDRDNTRIAINAASIVCSPDLTQYIPMGALVSLWKKQKLTANCHECSGMALIVGAVCIDSSDLFKWHGICPACKKIVGGSIRFFEVWGKSLKSKTTSKIKHSGTLGDIISALKDAEHRQNDFFLFRDNIDLILDKSEQILTDPKLYCCTWSAAYIGGSMTGLVHTFLGVLLELWKKEELIDKCPDCGGRVFILGAGGSNLSGSHTWHGVCHGCRKWQTGRKAGFSLLYGPVREQVKRYNIRDGFTLDEAIRVLLS